MFPTFNVDARDTIEQDLIEYMLALSAMHITGVILTPTIADGCTSSILAAILRIAIADCNLQDQQVTVRLLDLEVRVFLTPLLELRLMINNISVLIRHAILYHRDVGTLCLPVLFDRRAFYMNVVVYEYSSCRRTIVCGTRQS